MTAEGARVIINNDVWVSTQYGRYDAGRVARAYRVNGYAVDPKRPTVEDQPKKPVRYSGTKRRSTPFQAISSGNHSLTVKANSVGERGLEDGDIFSIQFIRRQIVSYTMKPRRGRRPLAGMTAGNRGTGFNYLLEIHLDRVDPVSLN